jgi:ATP-dependent RNA helicase RhlE
VRALILTPTRELAAQVEESVREYGKYLDLKSMVMFGGVGFQPQVDRLRQRVDILVATPGRLLDHASQKTVDLSAVEILVLDEADRMLDMGFIRDIRRVLALLPPKRQNLLFSATFSDDIRALADGLLDHPATVEVARRNTPTELVDQRAIAAEKGVKRALLAHLVNSRQWQQVLVFTRTKHGANRLAEHLDKAGITALAIHGNKSQNARTRALAEFKDGTLQVLVATDIAARGIDIDELPHVVNFELPNVAEDYVHRIGRTGRAGSSGEAVSLVCVDEFDFLRGIEKLIGRALPKSTIPGFEPDPNARPEPILMGGGKRSGAQGDRGARQGASRGGAQRPPQQQPRSRPAAAGSGSVASGSSAGSRSGAGSSGRSGSGGPAGRSGPGSAGRAGPGAGGGPGPSGAHRRPAGPGAPRRTGGPVGNRGS